MQVVVVRLIYLQACINRQLGNAIIIVDHRSISALQKNLKTTIDFDGCTF